MYRLKATKTSLYKLVAEYVDDLPPMKSGTKFWKADRAPDYFLEWITPEWDRAQAFFAACMGKAMLSVTVRDYDGHEVSRVVYDLETDKLRERGMVERFITAAERENQDLRASLERNRERRRRRWERKKKATRRKAVILAALAMISVAAFIGAQVTDAPGGGAEPGKAPPETPAPYTAPAEWADDPEKPLTEAEITEGRLMSGYYCILVPMPYEYQDYMRTYCAAYGVPYPLGLAVAEVESQFDMDAVGALGEVGIMQLNPGPGGAYHADLERATGMDPTTPEGNIACGCYLLGKYLDKYGDAEKAAMAYNKGESGAKNAWAQGVTSTAYSQEVMKAMERWECTVNAWNGQ